MSMSMPMSLSTTVSVPIDDNTDLTFIAPPLPLGPAETEDVALGGNSSSGQLLLTLSFVAAISAFIVGVMAFFVKIKQGRRAYQEEMEGREMERPRVVSFAVAEDIMHEDDWSMEAIDII